MTSAHSTSISDSSKKIRILVADRNPMGSQLLAESLGRNPRFEITCVAAADKVLPLVSLHKSDIAVIGHPIEAYLKAAEEGVVAAQFVVGLAHHEGYRIERNDRSAYYWLRMAEENSGTIRHRSHDHQGKHDFAPEQ
jgi:hypothetical protein